MYMNQEEIIFWTKMRRHILAIAKIIENKIKKNTENKKPPGTRSNERVTMK